MVILGETAVSRSFLIAQEIRTKLKMIVITESSKRSMKAQMKEANRQNARFVIIVGDNEINKGVVSIKDLKKGKSINIPIYCFNTHLRLNKTVKCHPSQILVIEGILILNDKKLREIIDYNIFLDCPKEIRMRRRISRDTEERGRKKKDIIDLFQNLLNDMHKMWVEPIKKHCDLILDTSKESNINQILNIILKNSH